jgi:hypothetical protein
MKRLLIVLNWWLEDFAWCPPFIAKVRELQEVVVREIERAEFAQAEQAHRALQAARGEGHQPPPPAPAPARGKAKGKK